MSRDLHSGVSDIIDDDVLIEALFVRLDIDTDPVYAWTGVGDKTFVGTNDTALVLPGGAAFEGSKGVGELSPVTDSKQGSEAVKLILPGVDLTDDYLNQILNQGYLWQFKKAYIWIAHLTEDGDVIGEPTRIKTGRIDLLQVKQGDKMEGILEVTVEAHQAYAQEALLTRYSEQKDIDSTDISQDYAYKLANEQAEIGGTGQGTGVGGPSSGGRAIPENRKTFN